jgi:tetratricopeptide (TPR) repeat protein
VRELEPPCLTLQETGDQLALIGADLTDEQVAGIHARSQGRPLFTEQLAAHLGDDHALPRMLLDLLDRRLAELSAEHWALTRLLGLAARPLTAAQVSEATGLGRDRLTEVLRELRERRLIRSTSEDHVELQHPLLAEAARNRLVPGEAAAVHRSLAEVLGTGTQAPAAEVAGHWQQAGDRVSELHWRVAAARQAATRFDWAQEADHWLRALELWPPGAETAGDPPITRALIYVAAMDALKESLQWDRAAAMSDAAEETLGEVDELTTAELLRRASEYRGEREGMAVGMELIDRALEVYRRHPPGTGFFRALEAKWSQLMVVGRYDEAVALTREAVDLAASTNDRRAHRHQLTSLAWHEGIEGEPARAFARLEEGQAQFPDGSDPVADIRQAVIATDVLLICGGRLEQVEEAAAAGLEIARAWGIDTVATMMLRANAAMARIRAGQLAAAAELVAVGDDATPDHERWPLHLVQALVEGRQGRLEAAAQRLDVVWRESVAEGEVDLEVWEVTADIDFWRGAPAATVRRLLHDLDVVVDSAPVRRVYPVLLVAARGAAQAAGPSAVERGELLTTLRDMFSRTRLDQGRDASDLPLRAHIAAADVELSRLAGEDRPEQWVSAATAWDRVDRPHDAAYCRWRGAQVALREGQGTVAGRLLKRAAADAREHVPLSTAIAATERARLGG